MYSHVSIYKQDKLIRQFATWETKGFWCKELAILIFQTLDGVMQAPKMPEEDRSGGFEGGGWADPYWYEVMQLVAKEAMAEPYDVLFGRNTFDRFSAHAGDDHPMHHFRKYVVTSKPDTIGWHNATAITDDTVAQINQLKQQQGLLLQVHGSHALIQLLLEHDLVDELRLWTFPVVLGSGKRLFTDGTSPAQFQLYKTDRTHHGVIMGLYAKGTGN